MLRNHNKRLISAIFTIVLLCSIVASTFAANIIQDRFFSTYNPGLYNNCSGIAQPELGTYTDQIQYRLNCYGYAIQTHILASVYVSEYGGYKQQPGDFASSSNRASVKENITDNNPTDSMNNIVFNMQLDTLTSGYSISEYVPSSEIVAQSPSGQRMIALVTGNYDYHFYMQHSDGKWSHKPGSGEVTNKSLVGSVILTNSNIKAKANQGSYAGGALKFFLITRDAVIDHPHGAYNSTTNQIDVYTNLDQAGDYPVTSTNISLGSKNAFIDCANDKDTYCFTPNTSGTYKFTTTCEADLDGRLYDSEGTPLIGDDSTSQVNISYYLTANKKYYIRILNWDWTVVPYALSIQKI